MRRLLSVGALLCSVVSGSAFASYSIVSSSQTTVGGSFIRTETVVQESSNALNKFRYFRVRKNIPDHALKGVIYLLPPLSNSFAIYEYTDTANYTDSFVGYFVKKGYDVWGYNPRDAELPAGFCEAAPTNCNVLNTWGIQSMLEDIEFVRTKIKQARPGQKPVLGGFSLGSMLTTATLNAHPNRYKAGILWEGILYTEESDVRALNADYCAADETQLTNGAYFDPTPPLLAQIAMLSETNPTGASPFPFFPPGTNNRDALFLFLAFPFPGPITQTFPGYVFTVGDATTRAYTYSNQVRVEGVSQIISNYGVTRQIRDLNCSLAGERTFTGNLNAFTKPIIVIGGSLGHAGHAQDTISFFGSTHKESHVYPGYGHLDTLTSANHKNLVERRINRWLNNVVFN